MVCQRLVAAVLVGALTSAGCTSMKTIRPARPGEPPFGSVQAGDTVVVQTRAGARARVVVQQIDGDTLIAADGRRFVRSDVVDVQGQAVSGPKTASLIAGIAAGILAIVAIAVGRWLRANSA